MAVSLTSPDPRAKSRFLFPHRLRTGVGTVSFLTLHHAVSAYHILKERGISLVYPERITLLADRVNDALEAEVAALRT
jgi:hypothetical protein